MKNILFAFILLALLSCKKEGDPAIDYSLLTQFKWQYLEPKEEMFYAEKITYSDTSSYVFNDDTFVFKSQHTIFGSTMGPGGHKFDHLLRQNWTNKGTWYLNAEKGTLHLKYTRCDGGSPAYNTPCVETLHHLTFTILSLNKNALKLRSVNSFSGEIIYTYSSIKK